MNRLASTTVVYPRPFDENHFFFYRMRLAVIDRISSMTIVCACKCGLWIDRLGLGDERRRPPYFEITGRAFLDPLRAQWRLHTQRHLAATNTPSEIRGILRASGPVLITRRRAEFLHDDIRRRLRELSNIGQSRGLYCTACQR